MKLILLVIFYSISSFGPVVGTTESEHAIYVSVLEIKKGSLMVKVFANDLEDAIFNQVQQRVNLLNSNCSENRALVSDYFKNHLGFFIDGDLMSYNFVSCEVNDISLWITFEFASPAIWSEVEITADYLMELFPTQSNVVSITYKKEKRMFRLIKGSTSETIIF